MCVLKVNLSWEYKVHCFFMIVIVGFGLAIPICALVIAVGASRRSRELARQVLELQRRIGQDDSKLMQPMAAPTSRAESQVDPGHSQRPAASPSGSRRATTLVHSQASRSGCSC